MEIDTDLTEEKALRREKNRPRNVNDRFKTHKNN